MIFDSNDVFWVFALSLLLGIGIQLIKEVIGV